MAHELCLSGDASWRPGKQIHVIAAHYIERYGTDEQKRHYLPRLARGLEIPCFALTSPQAGSDAASIPDYGVVCYGEHEGKRVLGVLNVNIPSFGVFLQAISSARSSILLSTPYLIPGEQLTASLVEAVQRGVAVRVLVPSVVNGSGVEYVTQSSQRDSFGPLLAGGIHLYEYAPALLHTKIMVIDGMWSVVGSTNFDNRSFGLNDEVSI